MVFKNISNLNKGITLIEILVVIFIIAALLTILVADFPKIQKQLALSRATNRFAQDLRRAQDMALSGAEIKKPDSTTLNAKGYGIYINLNNSANEYIIYADLNNDQKYNADTLGNIDCDNYSPGSNTGDCVIETIDLNNDAKGVVINAISNTNNSQYISINFNPPNPTISIFPGLAENAIRAGITFGLDSDSKNTRTVYMWTSGLIEAK